MAASATTRRARATALFEPKARARAGFPVLGMQVATTLRILGAMPRRDRQAVGRRGETCPGRLTAPAGARYLFAWTVFG